MRARAALEAIAKEIESIYAPIPAGDEREPPAQFEGVAPPVFRHTPKESDVADEARFYVVEYAGGEALAPTFEVYAFARDRADVLDMMDDTMVAMDSNGFEASSGEISPTEDGFGIVIDVVPGSTLDERPKHFD